MTIYEIGPPIRIRLDEKLRGEKQLNATRGIVDVLDRMSHLSMLNGFIDASESDEHRPELVEEYGSELKLNEVVNNSHNSVEYLETDVSKKFTCLLETLGIIMPDTMPTDIVQIYDKVWEDFSYKFGGLKGKKNRNETRDKLVNSYVDATGRKMQRPFVSWLNDKKQDRAPISDKTAA